MKRFTLKVALFLLLGAILNVAVAWGCAIWSPIRSSLPIEANAIGLNLSVPARWSRQCVAERVVAFGRVDIIVDDPGVDDQPAVRTGLVAQRRNAGWPMLCVGGSVTGGTQRDHLVLAPKFFDNRMIEMRGMKIVGLRPWIPLAPIWPGFAINTIVYAATLWLPFAMIGVACRRIRAHRGRCTACGYDLRGSEHRVCPECGPIASKQS